MKWFLVAAFTLAASSAYANKPPKATPQLLEKGKAVYTTNCVACHGDKGDGSGVAAAALNPKPRNFAEPFKNGNKPEQVFKTLSEGIPNTAMVAWAHLSEEDRWALTHYTLSLAKPAAGAKKK